MKTERKIYSAPTCSTVELEAQQIICYSGNTTQATHENFEEEEYEW